MPHKAAGAMETGSLTTLGHGFSAAAVVSAILGWLPTIGTIAATLVVFIWYTVQIYESKTVQKYICTRRQRKLHRLRGKIEHLVRIEQVLKDPK
jgi:hypothetical protein